jgi:phosphoglycerate dehydrogenase-like enzyme
MLIIPYIYWYSPIMGTLWVKRTDSSSYFPPDFHQMEKQALEGVPGVRFLGPSEDVPPTGDVCLLTNTHTRLSDWRALRERTKFVLHPNSGFDNLLPSLAEWADVPVVLGNQIRAPAVVQWALACILQHTTPITHFSSWPASREWGRPLLHEKNVLVVGLGPVGMGVADALRALGALVDTHDPFLGHNADLHAAHDIVVLAASLNQESRGLLGAEFFSHAPPDLLLVNPARGELVEEAALRAFLKRSPRARAYLDVHAQEPYPTGHWDDCPQVVATPHIAGVWGGLVGGMVDFEVEVLSKFQTLGRLPVASLLSRRKTAAGWYR